MSLFASGLRKLRRRPATWVTLGLLAGLLALVIIAVGATSNRAGASGPDMVDIRLVRTKTIGNSDPQVASWL